MVSRFRGPICVMHGWRTRSPANWRSIGPVGNQTTTPLRAREWVADPGHRWSGSCRHLVRGHDCREGQDVSTGNPGCPPEKVEGRSAAREVSLACIMRILRLDAFVLQLATALSADSSTPTSMRGPVEPPAGTVVRSSSPWVAADPSERSAGEILAAADRHGQVCPEDALVDEPRRVEHPSVFPHVQKTAMLGSSMLPGRLETIG